MSLGALPISVGDSVKGSLSDMYVLRTNRLTVGEGNQLCLECLASLMMHFRECHSLQSSRICKMHFQPGGPCKSL